MNKRIRHISYVLSALTVAASATTALAASSAEAASPGYHSAAPLIQRNAAPEAQRAMTRGEVINDMIKAGQDGTLQRLDDTVFHGS
ncbi:hypothetical protein [Burkholderia vietnamiensis]|uniref:hypothetical protein n=1 Tax=Burkholderia vietnamiensis TaxID=60552 RepID=UPI000753D5D2|nr:hypothetical protein [Burkholderia vietnamiensis]AOJ17119.1 hypothetical protein WJ02_25960 [Burkholderia vietnamiensis]KVE77668.1 hypothetical protein WI98_05745 [Burkholderia vietnamiensis]